MAHLTGRNSASRHAQKQRQDDRQMMTVGLLLGLVLAAVVLFGRPPAVEQEGVATSSEEIAPVSEHQPGTVVRSPLRRYAEGVRPIEEVDAIINR